MHLPLYNIESLTLVEFKRNILPIEFLSQIKYLHIFNFMCLPNYHEYVHNLVLNNDINTESYQTSARVCYDDQRSV